MATLAFLVLAGEPAFADQVKEAHQVLGNSLEITIESTDGQWGQERIRDAIAVARRLEAQLVASDESSDIARLNAAAGLGPRVVPLDLYRLLSLSRVMTRSTGEAFDVTVGPLLRRRSSERSGRAVGEALRLVGADKVVLRPPNRVALSEPGMSVDFSAILQGYVLERMAVSLRDGGVTKALLLFGDTTAVAVGPPEAEPPFRIWVPRGRSMAGSIALRDLAASTTRTRRRGDDARVPIVDPRSGRIVETDRQATVVAKNAAIAEAWSTALVVDPDGALMLLDEPRDVEALVFDEHGEHGTPRFVAVSGWKPARPAAGPTRNATAGPAPEGAVD